eukprot:5524-Heterococcus_DN1.PRE.3
MRSSWSGSDRELDSKAHRRITSTSNSTAALTAAAAAAASKVKRRSDKQWQEQKKGSVRGIYYAVGMPQLTDGYYYALRRSTPMPKKQVTADNVVGPFATYEDAAVAKNDAAKGLKRPPDFAKEVRTAMTILRYNC